jgi:transcriptional regulator with XRE-family HTH domain
MTTAHVSLLERGARNPPLTTIARLAAAVGVEPGRLLTGIAQRK